MADLLPSSLSTMRRGRRIINGVAWIPIYCANCGHDGGDVVEVDPPFAFYLCDRCVEKWGKPANLMLVPDEVHFARCRAEMLAQFGHELNETELVQVVDDAGNPLTKLLKERT